MKLEIHERLALLEILPRQGDYAGLMALRKAREIFSFTQEELDLYELKQTPDGLGNMRWDWNQAKASQRVLDAPIEQFVMETIRKKLNEMDEAHTLTEMYISLFEKFIINYRAVE